MKFSLTVHGAPHNSQAVLSASRFARAVVSAGHKLHRVFFYHDGVLTRHGAVQPLFKST
jgi:tRNA 2-thiouridine synthesizing protein D